MISPKRGGSGRWKVWVVTDTHNFHSGDQGLHFVWNQTSTIFYPPCTKSQFLIKPTVCKHFLCLNLTKVDFHVGQVVIILLFTHKDYVYVLPCFFPADVFSSVFYKSPKNHNLDMSWILFKRRNTAKRHLVCDSIAKHVRGLTLEQEVTAQ